MFRLLCFICCVHFTCLFSTVRSVGNVQFNHRAKNVMGEILFRDQRHGVSKAQQMCNKYTLRACHGTVFVPTRPITIAKITRLTTTTTTATTTTRPTKGSKPQSIGGRIILRPGDDFSLSTSVAGGKASAPKEHPHAALIGYGEYRGIRWSCGGSLISEEFVLTAAHCAVVNFDPATYVRLGELDLESVIDEADTKDFRITETFVHPEYNPPLLYNDIALFRFEGLDSFSSFIRPICLNTLDNFNVQNVTAVGWGATGYGEQGSPQLQDVELDVQDPNRCDQVHRGSRLPQGFNNKTMICAGYTPGGKDTCQGDSGGPLQYLRNNSGCDLSYMQVGIVSFGENCALPNIPAVYTRVSHFIPWIESIVW